MPTFLLVDGNGNVNNPESKRMTWDHANRENKDLHKQGYDLVWVVAKRVSNGKVVRDSNMRRI